MPKVFICSHTFVQKILGSSCLNKYVYLLSKNSMVIKSTQYFLTKHFHLLFCLSIKVASIFYMQQIYTYINIMPTKRRTISRSPPPNTLLHPFYLWEKKWQSSEFFQSLFAALKVAFFQLVFLSCCQNTRLLEGQMATFPRLPM